MTYKHVKFQDSPTMRALEKVALDKGLISLETMTKTASAEKPDYTPSENLMENVMKLCGGLRELGLEKQANELEGKFVDYKRAFNAYETSKEKGEDLVDAAHPEGSHDLVGVEGDATIETIVDQHLKNVKLVEKTPTGKLASVRDIIGAVKKVIAQDTNIIRKNLAALQSNVAAIMRIYHSENIAARPLSFAGGDLLDLVNSYNEKTINVNAAREIQTALNDLRKVYQPGFAGFGGIASDAWKKMVPYFDSAAYEANEIVKELTNPAPQGQPLRGPGKPPVAPLTDFESQAKKTVSTLNFWKGLVRSHPTAQAAGKRAAINWLDTKIRLISELLNDYSGGDAEGKQEHAAEYLNRLNVIKNQPGESLDEFKKIWIG